MTYADPVQRRKLISGLRALARFLESNPAVPAPLFTDVIVIPTFNSDAENWREIDAIASRIGSGTTTTSYRHYVTSRVFGTVEYRAVAIPADARKR